MSACLHRTFAVIVMAMVALMTISGQAAELVVNGDFEDTTDWGPYMLGPPPAGWTSTSNPAEQVTGVNAIGGSGTSALMVGDTESRRMLQQFDPFAPLLWEFNMDFATEDPGGPDDRTMDFALDLNISDDPVSRIFMRIVDVSDDGLGDMQFHSNWASGDVGWTPVTELVGSVIFDDNVEETPLVHHFKIVSHFDQAEPSYDVIVTNSDGVEFTALGLQLFNGVPPPEAGPEETTMYNSKAMADSLIDNYSLTAEIAGLIPGDANEDGKVTDADAAILATNWQQCDVGWGQGDFNDDGCVTDADAAILATHWQEGVEGTAAVPEPASIALLACGLLSLLLCRRRPH